MSQIVTEVTVHVSKPYVVIGGGWTSMRPQGLRRYYKAEIFGTKMHLTSKDEFKRRARVIAYKNTGSLRVQFTFVEEVA